jgi:transposase
MSRRRCGKSTAGCTPLVTKLVAGHELCRSFMPIPGAGPIAALTPRASKDRDVAAYFGLTSRRWQSGTSVDVQWRIGKAGDADMRRALYEAPPRC